MAPLRGKEIMHREKELLKSLPRGQKVATSRDLHAAVRAFLLQ